MEKEESFWKEMYNNGQTGWDIGSISTPLKTYFDQLAPKNIRILIPGCGNAYEAEYLFEKGFTNVFLADISNVPLNNFKKRVPSFPEDHLLHIDFFTHKDQYDRIIEQTFFSSFPPGKRTTYARQCHHLLVPGGKVAGVLFDIPLYDDHPPYGGSKEDYIPVFEPWFDLNVFERCYNSIAPRAGSELFILMEKPAD